MIDLPKWGSEEVGVLESASLVELSMNQLREDILSGALQPGERLIEETLTRRFGISRAPLREALRLLDEAGARGASAPARGAGGATVRA